MVFHSLWEFLLTRFSASFNNMPVDVRLYQRVHPKIGAQCRLSSCRVVDELGALNSRSFGTFRNEGNVLGSSKDVKTTHRTKIRCRNLDYVRRALRNAFRAWTVRVVWAFRWPARRGPTQQGLLQRPSLWDMADGGGMKAGLRGGDASNVTMDGEVSRL